MVVHAINGKSVFDITFDETFGGINDNKDVILATGCKRVFKLKTTDSINLVFSLKRAEKFEIGDYIFYEGNKYELTETPSPTYNVNTGGYDYDLTFNAEYFKWKNKIFKYTPEIGGQEAEWTLTATMNLHLEVVLKNLQHFGFKKNYDDGSAVEYSYSVDTTVPNKAKNITYSNTNILDALTQIANEWDCDWWLVENVIHFGQVEESYKTDTPLQFKIGDNVSNITRTDTKTLATRIYPFGSTKNLPNSYRKHLVFSINDLVKKNGNIYFTDKQRPIDSSWFSADKRNDNITTYQLSNYWEKKYNSSSYSKTVWSNNYAKNAPIMNNYIASGVSVGNEVFSFSMADYASNYAYISYTYTNATFPALSVNLRLTSVTFNARLLCNNKEVYSFTETIPCTSHGVNTQTGVCTSKVDLPEITGKTFSMQEYKGQSVNFSIEITAAPTLEFVNSSQEVTDIGISSNYDFIQSIKLRYDGKFVIEKKKAFSTINCNVQFYWKDDAAHTYQKVGNAYQAIINESGESADENIVKVGIPDIPKYSEAGNVYANYFGITEVKDWQVPAYYLTSDAVLYGSTEDYVLNGVVQRNLMLPTTIDGIDTFTRPYLESEEGLPEEQYIEQVVVFDDIYPRTKSQVTNVYSKVLEKVDDDEIKRKYFTYYLSASWLAVRVDEYGNEEYVPYSSFVFSKDYILEANKLEVTFTSGKLNGMTFEVAYHDSLIESGIPENVPLWEIVRNETYGMMLPNDVLKPSVDDSFVLTGWNSDCIKEMGLVGYAEQELLYKAKLWLKDKQKDPSNYDCTMMCDTTKDACTAATTFEKAFKVGQLVDIYSPAYFGYDSLGNDSYRTTHIIGFEYPIDYPYDNPKITVGESPTTSRLSNIEGKVNAIIKDGTAYSGGTSGGGSVYLIKKGDRTTPLDTNTYSALRIGDDYLRKNAEDTASKRITFADGINVGEGDFCFDTDGNINANEVSSKKVVTDEIKSKDFVSGQLGSGFAITTTEEGHTKLTIDDILVRYAAEFTTITFNQLEFLAGNRVLSAAGGEIKSVTPVYDSDSVLKGWKCLLNITDKDGNKVAENYWKIGDQARCQYSDKPQNGSSFNTRQYWRRVIGVGDDYIILSNQTGEYDTNSPNEPQANDKIVQLGNGQVTTIDGKYSPAVKSRQNAIMFEVVGDDAPCIKQYEGIDSFSLTNKIVTQISPKGNKFTGDFWVYNGTSTISLDDKITLKTEGIKDDVEGDLAAMGIDVEAGSISIGKRSEGKGTLTVDTDNLKLTSSGDLTVKGDISCKSLEYQHQGYNIETYHDDVSLKDYLYLDVKKDSFVIMPEKYNNKPLNYIMFPYLTLGATREVTVFRTTGNIQSITTHNAPINNPVSDDDISDSSSQEVTDSSDATASTEEYEKGELVSGSVSEGQIFDIPSMTLVGFEDDKGVAMFILKSGSQYICTEGSFGGTDSTVKGVAFKFLGCCTHENTEGKAVTYWTVQNYNAEKHAD